MFGTAARFAAALVAVSLVTWILGWYWLLLAPDDVLHGRVWQPLTFAFIESSPMGVLYGALILISIGGTLEAWWGKPRLVRFLVGVPIASGLVTTALGLVLEPIRDARFAGGGAMVWAAWCAYGWSLRRSQVSLYGFVLTGNQLAVFGILAAVLQAAFSSLLSLIPEAIAIAITYVHVRRSR